MRNLKRVLSTIMAIAMMMSVVVFSTSAAFNDQDKIVNTDAVNMNVALGIINGLPDGTFNPTGNVTRAEMAKMICVLLNGGNDPVVGAKGGAATFTDIRGHWAEGYIEYCVAMGIVSGMGDGTFAPNANVTATQAAKMLLVALGYDAAFEGFNGASWSVKINVAASQKNLYEDVVVSSVNAPLSRDNAAQMVWNALNAKEVKYTYSLTTVNGALQNVQVREDKTVTLLADKFNTGADFTSVMTGFSYNSTDKKFTYTFANATQFKSKVDFTNLFRMNTTVVYEGTAGTSATVYGMYAEGSSVIVSDVVGNLPAIINTDTEFELDDVTYKFDTNADTVLAYYFNEAIAGTTDVKDVSAATTYNTFKFAMIDDDDDGKINTMVIYPFIAAKVTYNGTSSFNTSAAVDGASTFDKEDVNVYTGIAKDDYVIATEDENTVDNTTTFVKADIVNGKVDGVKSGKVQVGGNWYKAAPTQLSGSESIVLGDTVKLVTVNGYYMHAKVDSTVTSSDLLVVVKLGSADVNGDYEAKLMFADGTSKVAKVDIAATAGALYSYELSDGVYELTAATVTNTGYDRTVSGVNFNESTDKLSDGSYIADDAVVFVIYKNATATNTSTTAVTGTINNNLTKATVVTGKNLKTWGVNFGAAALTTGFADTVSGYNTAKVLVLAADAQVLSAGGDTSYGYITTSPYMFKDGTDYYISFNVWNGTSDVAVKDKVSSGTPVASPYVLGGFISYTDAGSGLIDDTAAVSTMGSVVAYDGDENIKILATTLPGGPINLDLKITDDTKVIYFDSKKEIGIAGGTIELANELATAGTYEQNVMVQATGNEVDVLFVDINNKIDGSTVANGNYFTIATPTKTAAAANGITIASIVANKTTALAGESITYTVTYSGTATANTTLTFTAGANTTAPGTTTVAILSGVTVPANTTATFTVTNVTGAVTAADCSAANT